MGRRLLQESGWRRHKSPSQWGVVDHEPARSLSRRGVLLAAGSSVLAGCTGEGGPGSTASPGGSASSDAPHGSPSSAESSPGGPTLPNVERWQPSPGDLEPECKLAAVRHLEELGNGPRIATEAIMAQYGGLLDDTASVLVPCRSWRLLRRRVAEGGRTYDVRLTRVSASRWRITEVRPSRPGPPLAKPSTLAQEVVTHHRIDLPPAARADVLSGQIHDAVLATMLALAKPYRIGVSVLRSGHPTYVFGTDRPSDHPQGLAFDTWRINDRAVVDPDTPERLVTAFMRAAAEAGSDNVGGPYLDRKSVV